MTRYEAWWTRPKAAVGNPWDSPQASSTISSNSDSSHTSSSGSSSSVSFLDVPTSRALQLRYQELSAQLQHCHTWERQLIDEREKLVSVMFLSFKPQRLENPIAPPQPQAGAAPKASDHADSESSRPSLYSTPAAAKSGGGRAVDFEPPTRQALLTRLIDGKREDYRRIFVPGRGWLSKSKLQTELQVSEHELVRLAKVGS